MRRLLLTSTYVHMGTIILLPFLPKYGALILCAGVLLMLVYTVFRLFFTQAGVDCTAENEKTTSALIMGVWIQGFMQMVAIVVGCLMVEYVLEDRFELVSDTVKEEEKSYSGDSGDLENFEAL